MINVGNPHSLYGWQTNTPSSNNLSNPIFKLSIDICGNGNGLPWYGSIPSLSSNFTGEVFQSPSVPSNRTSYLRRTSNN